MRKLMLAGFLAFVALARANAQATAPALSGDQVVDHVSPAVVLILVSTGNGQVSGIGSGLIVRSDGIVLTANHVVKGMREVQVRLKNGEVYDHVELVATDEPRDVAALRIPASSLPLLPAPNSAYVHAGSPVYSVSNGHALPWTAPPAILTATPLAGQVPAAATRY